MGLAPQPGNCPDIPAEQDLLGISTKMGVDEMYMLVVVHVDYYSFSPPAIFFFFFLVGGRGKKEKLKLNVVKLIFLS